MATTALTGALPALGPLAGMSPSERLQFQQVVMSVFAVASALAAVTIAQRRKALTERATLLAAERAARERAEEAIRLRDEFLTTAAHELRTPVAAAKAAAQLLMRRHARGDSAPDRLAITLAAIEEATDRLARLVSDLLDVSRIQGGQLRLTNEPVDLGELVQDQVQHTRELADEGHRFSVSTDNDCTVLGDAVRLRQVLAILLDNAVKYSPTGGAVTVAVQRQDGGALVTIRDEGMGFPPDRAHMLFQPFGRAPNADAGHLAGMGLGLYISRNIIERHGGRVWLESEGEQQGTTASLWLPLAGSERAAVAAGRSEA